MKFFSMTALTIVLGILSANNAFAGNRTFSKNYSELIITDPSGKSCSEGSYSLMSYHYNPKPDNLVVKSVEGHCVAKKGIKKFKAIEYYSNGKLHAVGAFGYNDLKYVKEPFRSYGEDYCSKGSYCVMFEDGEVWSHHTVGWSGWNMSKIRDSNDIIEKRKKESRIAEKKEQERVAKFRRKMEVGDDTTEGIIIEIKGKLVKVQSDESQCSQRNYEGSCLNWISTPVEKWIKRSQVYPR